MNKIINLFENTEEFAWGNVFYNGAVAGQEETIVTLIGKDDAIYIYHKDVSKAMVDLVEREVEKNFDNAKVRIYKAPNVVYNTRIELYEALEALWVDGAFNDVATLFEEKEIPNTNEYGKVTLHADVVEPFMFFVGEEHHGTIESDIEAHLFEENIECYIGKGMAKRFIFDIDYDETVKLRVENNYCDWPKLSELSNFQDELKELADEKTLNALEVSREKFEARFVGKEGYEELAEKVEDLFEDVDNRTKEDYERLIATPTEGYQFLYTWNEDEFHIFITEHLETLKK